MPEPTDHRAEAERWLLSATDSWANADTGSEDEVRTRIGYAISEALIGIGHRLGAIHEALLALGQQPVKLSQNPDTRCPWWTDGQSWALWSGPPAKQRCTHAAGHEGNHY